MARRSKYTPQVRDAILEAVRVGATLEDAANYAGVSYESLRRWLNHGQNGITPFVELYSSIKQNEGQSVVRWLALMEKIAKDEGQWQALAWKLERRYPQHYGRRTPEVQVLLQGLSDDELLKVATRADLPPEALIEGPKEGDVVDGEVVQRQVP